MVFSEFKRLFFREARPKKEMPASWFSGLLAGNAKFPFTDRGVGTFALNAMLSDATSFEDILAVRNETWFFTPEQEKAFFVNAMGEMHARYGIMVAPPGKRRVHHKKVSQKHPDATVAGGRSIARWRIKDFTATVIHTAPDLLSTMRDQEFIKAIPDEKQQYALVRSFISHAANLLGKDPDIAVFLEKLKTQLGKHSMGSHFDIAHQQSLPPLFPDVGKTLRELRGVMYEKLLARLNADTVFLNYVPEEKDKLIHMLVERYFARDFG